MVELTGRCGCGAVAWRAGASPFRAVLCHCLECRGAAGLPCVGYIGFAKALVTWSGARAFRSATQGVTRGACPACGTALSYMCTRWPGELYLHAATLDDLAAFEPQAHIHWDARLPGPLPQDGLPRYAGRGPAELPPLQRPMRQARTAGPVGVRH